MRCAGTAAVCLVAGLLAVPGFARAGQRNPVSRASVIRLTRRAGAR